MNYVLIAFVAGAWGYIPTPMLVTETREQCEVARTEVVRRGPNSIKEPICLEGNVPVQAQ